MDIKEESEAWEAIIDLDQKWEEWKEEKRTLEKQEKLEAQRKLENRRKRGSWTPSWSGRVNTEKKAGESSRSVNPKDAESEDLKDKYMQLSTGHMGP